MAYVTSRSYALLIAERGEGGQPGSGDERTGRRVSLTAARTAAFFVHAGGARSFRTAQGNTGRGNGGARRASSRCGVYPLGLRTTDAGSPADASDGGELPVYAV